MRKLLLDRGDDMAPDVRWHELRIEAAEASDISVGEPNQAFGPPACDLLRNHRIVEAGIGGVRLRQRRPGIDPLARRLFDVKPARRGLRNIRMRSDAADDDIGEEAQSVLPASLGEAGDERIRVVGAVDRAMNALMIAREEYIPVRARHKQRPGEHVVELHFLASPQVVRPGSAITG
jgi:hypothetical protein